MNKNQKKGLAKEDRQARKEKSQRNKEARMRKQELKKEERDEKALDNLRKQVEKKGKFPPQKTYLLWEQYLIDVRQQSHITMQSFVQRSDFSSSICDILCFLRV